MHSTNRIHPLCSTQKWKNITTPKKRSAVHLAYNRFFRKRISRTLHSLMRTTKRYEISTWFFQRVLIWGKKMVLFRPFFPFQMYKIQRPFSSFSVSEHWRGRTRWKRYSLFKRKRYSVLWQEKDMNDIQIYYVYHKILTFYIIKRMKMT